MMDNFNGRLGRNQIDEEQSEDYTPTLPKRTSTNVSIDQIMCNNSPRDSQGENAEARLTDFDVKTPENNMQMQIDCGSLSNPKIYSEVVKAENSPLSGAV